GLPWLVDEGRWGSRSAGVVEGVGSSRAQRRRGPRRRLDVEGAGARRGRWFAVARRRGALGKPKRPRRRGRGRVEGGTWARAAATARRRGRGCSSRALVCRGSSTRGVGEAEAPASSRAWARRGLNVDEGRGDGSTSRALVLVERNTCTKKGRGTRGSGRTPLFP